MVDGVDLPAETGEVVVSQPEPGLRDVARVYAEARREGVVPDLGLLHVRAQPFEPRLGAVRPHDAVDDRTGVVFKQVAHEEATDEAGRTRHEDFADLISRNRRIRHPTGNGGSDEPAQRVEISLTMGRQGAAQRWHRTDRRRRRIHARVHACESTPARAPFGK